MSVSGAVQRSIGVSDGLVSEEGEVLIHGPVPTKATRRGSRASLHHFESEVGGARCLDRACPPQFDPLRVEILEEPDAAAEQDGDEVDLHLVQ
jgi:hypothetical protein